MGMNWHKLHTRTILIISLLLSEMTTVSMRITWIWQSAFLTSRFLICPWGILWRSRSHWLLAAFHPKGPLCRFPFSFFFYLNLFRPKCTIFPFCIFYIIFPLFREVVPPPTVPKLSITTQTESGLPPLPNKRSSLLSSFIR